VASKAGGEFVQLLHPLFCCPGRRRSREASRVDRIDFEFEQVSSLLGVVVRLRCGPRDLAVQPTKRTAMSLEDSWSLVVMVVPSGWFVETCPAITRDACDAGPGSRGRLADSGRQPEERLQTDVRALRAIVAVDLQGARPAGDALAAAAYL
jgi:hypothetical protein